MAFHTPTNGQNTQHSGLRISLITCEPGEELYSIFGHNAIRIVDSVAMRDYTFNYGTFDFDDKDFYIKFMRGKLLYFLSMDNTSDFIAFYQYCNRGITEQVLQLSEKEKIDIQQYLYNNIKNENKYYQYDFFYDNCSTRPRDLLQKNIQPQPSFSYSMPSGTTFRQAIHAYLDKGHQAWSKLGIDILLGKRTDKVMSAAEQQFLPDNLMASLDSSSVKLVSEKIRLYQSVLNETSNHESSPLVIFSLVCFLYVLMGLLPFTFFRKLANTMDLILFSSLGLLGILLILMWVATDHSMTKDNFNLLWAHPFFLMIPFLKYGSGTFRKKSTLLLLYISITTILSWFFLPQQLNIALLPIALLTSFRLYLRFKSN